MGIKLMIRNKNFHRIFYRNYT